MPGEPLVLVNPAAGGGRALRAVPWLRDRLRPRPDARLVVTRRPGDAEALAADAAGRGYDRVVAVGGDGTVQEVVNGLLAGSTPCVLGLVPLGLGNDLARSLGLPAELGSAWKAAIGRGSRAVDVARARNGDGRERWFASAGGIGFDVQVAAAMAERRGWQAGRAGYLFTTLNELRRFENRAVAITIDGSLTSRSVLFVAIANGAYYGGGMKIAPEARPDDGLLDVCIVGDVSRIAAVGQIPNLYRGTHVRHPAVSMHTARVIGIEGDDHTRVHLDGEPFGKLPLHVSLTAGAIEVAVPVGAEPGG